MQQCVVSSASHLFLLLVRPNKVSENTCRGEKAALRGLAVISLLRASVCSSLQMRVTEIKEVAGLKPLGFSSFLPLTRKLGRLVGREWAQESASLCLRPGVACSKFWNLSEPWFPHP